uniref:Uncharacterized protein n=1 Tax=Rhizophora mucronata TaxID=61149 RepID=A0A2P2IQ90_RHIMU
MFLSIISLVVYLVSEMLLIVIGLKAMTTWKFAMRQHPLSVLCHMDMGNSTMRNIRRSFLWLHW